MKPPRGQIEKLLVVNALHGEETAHSLARSLKTIADFLGKVTSAEFLSAVIKDRGRLRRIKQIVTGLDHVGLVTNEPSIAPARAAMKAAGFDSGYHVFSSKILARELGQAMGRRSVPIKVLAARAGSAGGSPVGVEIFMPSSRAIEQVKAWVRKTGSLHVAFRLKNPACFTEVAHLMEAEKFFAPAFPKAPLTNKEENVTVLYFDGRYGKQSLRIEFIASPED